MDEALSLPSCQTEPRLVVTLLLVVDVVVVAMTAAQEADEGESPAALCALVGSRAALQRGDVVPGSPATEN